MGVPDPAGGVTTLEAARVVLGREANGPAKFEGTEVSRQHADVRREGVTGQPVLRDLGSTNGSFVNGARISERALVAGDVVRLGDWVGLVIADAAVVSALPAAAQFRELARGCWPGPISRARSIRRARWRGS